jgi:diaminopimelate decarboxylase
VTQVLDIMNNGMDVAIVDAAVETHMLDLLIYHTDAKMEPPPSGAHTVTWWRGGPAWRGMCLEPIRFLKN